MLDFKKILLFCNMRGAEDYLLFKSLISNNIKILYFNTILFCILKKHSNGSIKKFCTKEHLFLLTQIR